MIYRDDYRIKQKHRRDCYACAAVKRGDWPHPWGVHVGTRFLDTLGRRNPGGIMWEEYNCNDPNCPAKLLVKADTFLEGAPVRSNR